MKLFWKIFAAVFISFMAVVSLIAYIIILRQVYHAETHIVERYTLIGSYAAREMEYNYLESRWPLERLEKVTKSQGFRFWWVVRADGIIHLADQEAFIGTSAYDYFPRMQGKTHRQEVILNYGGNYGILVNPVQLGKKQWSFWLGFSLSETMTERRNIILWGLWVSLASLLMLGTLLYFIIRHFTRPIKELTRGAAVIGRGDLTHKVGLRSDDELGRLAEAFNKMVDDLQAGERFLGSVFTSIQDGLSILGTDYTILRVNPAMERAYAQAMPLVGKKCYAAYHGRKQPCERCPAQRTLVTGEPANAVVLRGGAKGAVRRWRELYSFPLIDQAKETVTGIVLYSRDITARKQAEEALRESERRFQDIAENTLTWIWEVDAAGKYTYASPVVEKLLGYEPQEILGKHFYDLFHPEEREELTTAAFAVIASKQPFREFLNRNLRKNGEVVWLSTSGVPILDEKGSLLGYRGADLDVTGPFRAETALRDNERFLASIFASIQDGISILDNDYTIIRVNLAMERAYAQAMPLVGKKCYAAYHGRTEPCEVCPTRRTLETGEAAREMVVERKPDGEIFRYIDLYTFPMGDSSTGKLTGVVEYVRDITREKLAEEALRRSEEQLRQAQKMEAVGQLAGGVAHDFNNILMGIMGYTELMLLQLKDGDPMRQDLTAIQQAAARAAALTQQLLAFSRKQMLHPQPLHLNALVANVEKMLRRIIDADIELETVLQPGLGVVQADPGQMEHVIINLAVNSRDAMPHGGRLTLETANVELDAQDAREHPEIQPGPYVRLVVTDTGVGMDSGTQARIFEPFFTTKELGKGTGLGLSTVYGIIKQSGGYIYVESASGQGTTFRIYLPRIEAAVVAAGGLLPAAVAVWGSETILLVEDEATVRLVTGRMLQQSGYAVLAAAHGPEALQLSARHPGPIHLVLTDVVMPGMSGQELVARLRPQRPELKVLYMSGHADYTPFPRGHLEPEFPFIQKPFRHDVLLHKVREALDLDQHQPRAMAVP